MYIDTPASGNGALSGSDSGPSDASGPEVAFPNPPESPPPDPRVSRSPRASCTSRSLNSPRSTDSNEEMEDGALNLENSIGNFSFRLYFTQTYINRAFSRPSRSPHFGDGNPLSPPSAPQRRYAHESGPKFGPKRERRSLYATDGRHSQ